MSNAVPEGWKAEELGDLAKKIEGGGTPPKTEPSYWAGNIPWATVKDLRGTALKQTEEFITETGLKNSSSKLVPAETMIIASRMAVGKAVFFDRDVAINQDLKAFYPRSDVDWRFLLQWYLSKSELVEGLATGSTVKGIRLEDLKALPIDVPPLPEQQKIAAILSSVDDVIEKTRAQIDKLKDLKTGMMQELLTKGIGHTAFKDSPVGRIPEGWRVLRIGELLSERKQKGEDGLPIYSVLMDGGMVPRSTVERRVASELESSDNRLVRKGDLAYNMMRMWQGASGIAPTDCLVSPAYVVCYPSKNIDSGFLGYMLKMPSAIQLLRRYSQGLTSDRLRLYFEHFKFISFAIPPVEEQRCIANMLRAIDDDIDKKNAQLSGREALKKALMQDLLTGKIRVNIDNKENAVA